MNTIAVYTTDPDYLMIKIWNNTFNMLLKYTSRFWEVVPIFRDGNHVKAHSKVNHE